MERRAADAALTACDPVKFPRRAPVAQWIEQSPPKGQVGRSIRLRGANYQCWPITTQDCGSRPGILIVDNSPEIRDLLEKLLPRHGLNVWTARDCLQAVDIYWHAHSQIQLVVLEADMPGIDGPQTLLALRGIKPNVRCCFMSGDLGRYTERTENRCPNVKNDFQ